jgi:beta-lactamase regulating signal transducer with metallopeptidase domain
VIMPTFGFHEIAGALAERIVDSLIEGTAIGIFAAGLLGIRRRQNAGGRFAIWFSALMTIAAVPVLTGWMQPLFRTGDATHSAAFTVPESWASGLLLLWGVIAAGNLFILARALRHLQVLRQTCAPLDQAVDSELQGTLARNPIKRSVLLRSSEQVRVPTVIGLWKPMIVFPRWVTEDLSSAELDQILLHELAHLRRWDDWTNLAQQLVKAIFFFHPAVWWIERKVSLEREIACDEAVVQATASPRAYAECLAHLAEMSFVRRSVALAQAVLGKMRHTSLRVARILDPQDSSDRRENRTPTWKPAAALITTFAVACCVWMSREPGLISFQEYSNPANATAHAFSSRQSTPHTFEGNVTAASPSALGSYIIPAKFVHAITPTVKSRSRSLRTATVRSSAAQPDVKSIVPYRLVEFTGRDSEFLVLTDAVLVVIQNDQAASSQQRPAHIEMWHLLVLHPAADEGSTIPPKKT